MLLKASPRRRASVLGAPGHRAELPVHSAHVGPAAVRAAHRGPGRLRGQFSIQILGPGLDRALPATGWLAKLGVKDRTVPWW